MSKPFQVCCPKCSHEFVFKRVSKKRRAAVAERFWSKVYCDPNTGCFLWYGALDSAGRYGEFGVPSDDPYKASKIMRAHRFSYELHKGKIPEGLVVMHRCDTPRCVNPDHLSLGTQFDNMRDCAIKRRKNTKLSAEDVLEMRQMWADGKSFNSIRERFGTGNGATIAAVTGKTWAHVPMVAVNVQHEKANRGPANGMTKYTEHDVRAMREAHANGERINQIAERFGMSYAQAQKIIRRKAWAHVA